ncbi:ECF-type sigma factor [Haloferula sp. BvORR071]|uniref:ECF-type sigma factor n=1 Tax=Haloferula sp. BvORR071 TaxID=1396141 RepID=UPI0009461C01|nr:ECF-type sigma factor [Haloferula sp. BvORR071]
MSEPSSAAREGKPAETGTDLHGAEQLVPLVYDELRRLAGWRLGNEASPGTLQATALVHEAYLRLSPGESRWDGKAHFFSAAAETMRRILVDRARRRQCVKHGGELARTDWVEDAIVSPVEDSDEVLAVHEILDRFSVLEPRKAELVKLRYFVGMTIEDAGDVLGISPATAKRDWVYARAWLYRELKDATTLEAIQPPDHPSSS